MSSRRGQFFVDLRGVRSPSFPDKSRVWWWGGTYSPPPWAVPHHDGMWPHLLATSGHLCLLASLSPSWWQVSHLAGGPVLGWFPPVPRLQAAASQPQSLQSKACIWPALPGAVSMQREPLGAAHFLLTHPIWPTQKPSVLKEGWPKDSGRGLS